MADFTCTEISEDQKDEYNRFILSTPHGSIHQRFEWKAFQQKIPGRSIVRIFGVRGKSQEFLATVLCVQMNTGFLDKTWWYSPRGPVFDDSNHEAGAFLITEVQKFLRKTSGMFWRIDPYQKIPEKISGIRFRRSTQDYQPTDTLELDLTKENDVLLSEMKRKGRYNINLASKKGVEFKTITGKKFLGFSPEEKKKWIDLFWKLNTETCERDAFSGHECSYYKNFLESLPEQAVLFFATFEGIPLATAISTFSGKKSIYYFGASTSNNEYRKLMAPYGLQWHMIQYAKERKCETYDFLGIAPENQPNHAYAGISEFKWKFGGERKIYPHGKEVVFQKGWYFLYRVIKKFLRK